MSMTPQSLLASPRPLFRRRGIPALVGGALVASLPLMSLPAQAAGTPSTAAATTTTTTVATPTTTRTAVLRYGDRGPRVRALQRLLGIKRTGVFDRRTRNAVRRIQRSARLRASGVVTARTMTAIKRNARKRAASRALPRAGGPVASKRYAKAYIRMRYRWGSAQFSCLAKVWQRESGWRYRASNPNGRYHGIPQTSSAVWRAAGYSTRQYMTSPAVQIRVGTRYIKGRYATPCRAWAFWRSHHWY